MIDKLKPRVIFFYNLYIENNHTYQILFGTNEGEDYALIEIDAKTGVVTGSAIGPGHG